jgi:hypothetical protein
MRNATFKKFNGEWIARPFKGWEYRISKDATGFHLSFNGTAINHSADRIDNILGVKSP